MRLFSATTILIATCSAPLAAQEPGQQADHLFQHQAFYPEGTIATFGVNALDPHRAEFEKTGLFRLIDGSPELAAILPDAMAKASLFTGLSHDELVALMGSGFSVGLTGWQLPSQFKFLGVVELGDSRATIERLLEQRIEPSGSTAGIDTYAIPIGNDTELVVCFPGSNLLFASSAAEIAAALARWANPKLPSMANDPKFQRVTAQLTSADSTQPLAAGYLDLDRILDGLLAMVPEEKRATAHMVVDILHLRQASALGYSALPGDGQVTDHLRLSMISEPKGVLAAFLPEVAKIDTELNRFVPTDVQSFVLTHIQFDELFAQTLQTIGAFDSNVAAQARMMLQGMASQTGVDIEGDLIGSMGQRVLTLQWPNDDEAPDFAVLFELSNETRFDGAIRKLGFLEHSSWQNFQIYSAPAQMRAAMSSMPTIGIGRRYCVLAASRARLEKTLAGLTTPRTNIRAKHLFAAQPAGTITAGWSDLGKMVTSYADLFTRIEQFADPAGAARFKSTFKRLAATLGSSETRVVRNRGGVSIISRSATGSFGALLIGALSAAAAGTATPAGGMATKSHPHSSDELETFRDLLTEITVSELAHHESGSGNFTDLQGLVMSGSIEQTVLGENIGSGVFDQGTHLIKVFLPTTPAERSKQFMVVAWPHDSELGNVYACREDGLPLVNNLLARAGGIAEIRLRDIFVNGTLSGNMTPGWRRLEGQEMVIAQSNRETSAVADRKVFEQILLAEERGRGDPAVLIPILESSNPKLAGRAAYAIGKLGMNVAVPDLIKMLGTHANIEVQRFAMSALKDLRDPRTIQASAVALDSKDLKLRTLAAENLGHLRKPQAVDPLLSFLASDTAPVIGEERPDRVQAILALCDIGEPRSLLATANSVHAGSTNEEEALTYMFQTLTSKLTAGEEATTLMTVLDHEGLLLRRYAIQRLGKLKDRNTVPVLEERLALEGPQLRPLIELALQGMQSNRDAGSRIDLDYIVVKFEQWKQHAQKWKLQAQKYWNDLEQGDKNKVAAGGAGGLILAVSILLVVRRRRRQRRSEQWITAMVSPSEDGDYPDDQFEYEEAYQEEFVSEEQPANEYEAGLTAFHLPPEAQMPTGDGWEQAELGIAPDRTRDGLRR